MVSNATILVTVICPVYPCVPLLLPQWRITAWNTGLLSANHTMNKKAYQKAYDSAQAGGMNETESHEFATDQASRMQLKKTKTCEGCRAIKPDGTCDLGFNNRGEYSKALGRPRIKPQEPCFKPLTIKELFAAQEIKRTQ